MADESEALIIAEGRILRDGNNSDNNNKYIIKLLPLRHIGSLVKIRINNFCFIDARMKARQFVRRIIDLFIKILFYHLFSLLFLSFFPFPCKI